MSDYDDFSEDRDTESARFRDDGHDHGEEYLRPVGGVNSRDWCEDFTHENGNYNCKCSCCGLIFVGHKRRVVCRKCATQTLPAQEQP
jgi:hypothetical protein